MEAEIVRHQNTEFGVDQRLVSLAMVSQPLSEIAYLLNDLVEIVVVVNIRGDPGSQGIIVFEPPARQTGGGRRTNGVHSAQTSLDAGFLLPVRLSPILCRSSIGICPP